MKNFIKKNFSIFFVLTILIFPLDVYSKNTNIKYTNSNISNYFLGIISLNQNYTDEAYKYLNKAKLLKNIHSNYNIQFIRTLVLLDKFEQAFSFSRDLQKEGKLFFEADLLLGLDYFINKDYKNAKKHFQRLSINETYYNFFQGFLDNFLLSLVAAAENNQEESFQFFNKVPKRYNNLKLIQDSFLQCYFNTPKTIGSFKKFESILSEATKDYGFLIINLRKSSQARSWKECVSWFRVEGDPITGEMTYLLPRNVYIISKLRESSRVKNMHNTQLDSRNQESSEVVRLTNSGEVYSLPNPPAYDTIIESVEMSTVDLPQPDWSTV